VTVPPPPLTHARKTAAGARRYNRFADSAIIFTADVSLVSKLGVRATDRTMNNDDND